jgi:hypothetical protein
MAMAKVREQKTGKHVSRKCMGSMSLQFFCKRNGAPTDALK